MPTGIYLVELSTVPVCAAHNELSRIYLLSTLVYFIFNLDLVADTNVYSPNSIISLDYFCGFIDGQNALTSRTVWNIHVRPIIHLHFLAFSLLNNYCFCDFEYLTVTSNSKSSIFCGNRHPWLYDASHSSAQLILSTPRFGSKTHTLEVQYYGAYVLNYQYFIMDMQSNVQDKLLRNLEENVFENFHFVANSRLDILHLAAVNLCYGNQMICYDGPGNISPVLQFTNNQSTWYCLSSTFQMVCKFSRADLACTQASHLQYHAVHTRKSRGSSEINAFYSTNGYLHLWTITLDKSDSRGTNSYIKDFHNEVPSRLSLHEMHVSFPYMLYEGGSCMYGGIYIIETFPSRESEILSHCTSFSSKILQTLEFDVRNFSIGLLLVHYSGYSREKIYFFASFSVREDYLFLQYEPILPLNLTGIEDETAKINITSLTPQLILLQSYILNLRTIQYFHISFEQKEIPAKEVSYHPKHGLSCVYITIVYAPPISNIKGTGHDMEILNTQFKRWDKIESVFINMSNCNKLTFRWWRLMIHTHLRNHQNYTSNVLYFSLPKFSLKTARKCLGPSSREWIMVHVVRPDNVPSYAIFKMRIVVHKILSRVYLEFPIDNHRSTLVYRWIHSKSSNHAHMTVDETVNIIVTLDNAFPDTFSTYFIGAVHAPFYL